MFTNDFFFAESKASPRFRATFCIPVLSQFSRPVLFLLVASLIAFPAGAEEPKESDEAKKGFQFETVKLLETTPVRNQARTGTCWSFATNSFIETELIRMGKGSHDLSEMLAVRVIYPQKARRYVRYHGNATLGPGSLMGDAMRVWREQGAVPESAYDGRFVGQDFHNHAELDAVLKAMLDVVVDNPGETLSPAWPKAIEAVLDTYMGELPESFKYQGKEYTPREFADSLGFDPDDYVELTSFTHHPFHQWVELELPDNWAGNRYFNVPLGMLETVLDRSIQLGYSVGWAGDVSEKGFLFKKGVAILPAKSWQDRENDERNSLGDAPEPELDVTQQLRQKMFDSYATQDDHGMHVVGVAADRNGDHYYMIKNSWGTLRSEHDGYLYMSKAYVRAKTIGILVHRKALPPSLADKLTRASH
jgi:bleomycin hydrolase